MAKDACGVEVRVGDTVMLASTGKSAGIYWERVEVVRVSEKSFWSRLGGTPRRPGNCIVVDKADG